jgi:uncharacterized protein YgbK (DUF1537 family)
MLLAILADDLTGALDTGVQFRRRGFSTRAVLPFTALDERALAAEVLVVDLETRNQAPSVAAERVAGWAERLREGGVSRFYLKIDSTLRGPWAESLRALKEALGAPAVLVCPAYPDQGRVVRDGSVWLTDPPRRVGSVAAGLRRAGLRVARSWGADAGGVVVADAETDADLDALVDLARERGGDVLLCGSAGLAGAWAGRLARVQHAESGSPAPGERAAFPSSLPIPRRLGRAVLVAAGSANPVTRVQVEQLLREEGVTCLPVEARRGVLGSWATVLRPPHLPPEGEESSSVAEALAEAASHVCRASRFDALVLTGGETAGRVLRALEATGVDLEGECLPGMPLSRIRGGTADGAWMVTKAGGFGGPESLAQVVEWLQGS